MECIDLLVNNAGINTNMGWRKCMEVCFQSTNYSFYYLCQVSIFYILQYYWFDVHFVRFYCLQITMPYIVPIDVPRRHYFSHCKLVEAVSLNSIYVTLSN